MLLNLKRPSSQYAHLDDTKGKCGLAIPLENLCRVRDVMRGFCGCSICIAAAENFNAFDVVVGDPARTIVFLQWIMVGRNEQSIFLGRPASVWSIMIEKWANSLLSLLL
jgi:hypothetical protein